MAAMVSSSVRKTGQRRQGLADETGKGTMGASGVAGRGVFMAKIFPCRCPNLWPTPSELANNLLTMHAARA